MTIPLQLDLPKRKNDDNEAKMNGIEMIKDDDSIVIVPTNKEDDDSKAKRIIAILATRSRCAECGSIVKIPACELLEEELEQTRE